MKIAMILKQLRGADYFGAGPYTEIAKGKHELDLSWAGLKRKIKRLWLSRR